jgi:hypothetical protein
VTWPDAPVAVAAVKAQEPIAVPTDARADSVSDDAEKTARRAEPTNNAEMSIIIFLLLALGLAVVGIVSRVVVKSSIAPNPIRWTITASMSGATINPRTDPSSKGRSSIHLYQP